MWLVVKGLWGWLVDILGNYAYFKNRLKRITDITANLGVASLAVGLFRPDEEGTTALWWGIGCFIVSILLTMEDK